MIADFCMKHEGTYSEHHDKDTGDVNFIFEFPDNYIIMYHIEHKDFINTEHIGGLVKIARVKLELKMLKSIEAALLKRRNL